MHTKLTRVQASPHVTVGNAFSVVFASHPVLQLTMLHRAFLGLNKDILRQDVPSDLSSIYENGHNRLWWERYTNIIDINRFVQGIKLERRNESESINWEKLKDLCSSNGFRGDVLFSVGFRLLWTLDNTRVEQALKTHGIFFVSRLTKSKFYIMPTTDKIESEQETIQSASLTVGTSYSQYCTMLIVHILESWKGGAL